MRKSLRSLALACALITALGTGARAQAVSGVELRWLGTRGCAEPTGVLEAARALLAHEPGKGARFTAQVQLQELGDGSLRLRFEAASDAGTKAERELVLGSCAEAKQAAGMWIAMTIEPESAVATTPAREPEPEPESPPALTPEPEPEPESPPALTPEPSPRSQSAAPSPPLRLIGLFPGLELPVSTTAAAVITLRLAGRWGSFHLEGSVSAWLPARGQLRGLELEVAMLGGGVAACHGFALDRWELGPCAGVELTRLSAELDGADAGDAAWLRALLGGRLGVWLSERVLLSLSADGLLALHRPRFETDAGHRARAPAGAFAARLGLAYAFGAKGHHGRGRARP